MASGKWRVRADALGVSDADLISIMTDRTLGAVEPFEPLMRPGIQTSMSGPMRTLATRRASRTHSFGPPPTISKRVDDIVLDTELDACEKTFAAAFGTLASDRKRTATGPPLEEGVGGEDITKLVLRIKLKDENSAATVARSADDGDAKRARSTANGAGRRESKPTRRRSRPLKRLEREVGDDRSDEANVPLEPRDSTRLDRAPRRKRGRSEAELGDRPSEFPTDDDVGRGTERKRLSQRRSTRNVEAKKADRSKRVARRPRLSLSPVASRARSVSNDEKTNNDTDGASRKPKTALDCILSFARGNTSGLSKLEKGERTHALKKRTSVATFSGCEDFSDVDLSAYLGALASLHLKALKARKRGSSYPESLLMSLDSIDCNSPESELAQVMTARSKLAEAPADGQKASPPFIRKSLDLVQLFTRLWQKMSAMDDSVFEEFLRTWHAGGVMTAALAFNLELLKVWRDGRVSESAEPKQAELFEWCIRLTAKIVDFELSPLSPALDLGGTGSDVLQMIVKGEDWSLHNTVETVLDFVGCDEVTVSRECRTAASDICQVCIVRQNIPWQEGSPKSTVWKSMNAEAFDLTETITEHKTFWCLTMHSAVQVIQKQQQTEEATFAVAFLVAVLSRPACFRRLLETEMKLRHSLLSALVKVMGRMSRNPLSFFVAVERNRRSCLSLPSSVDLVRKLMSFAVLQRELVSSGELGKKMEFLEAIEGIITSTAKFLPHSYDSATFLELAKRGAFGTNLDEATFSVVSGSDEGAARRTYSEHEDEALEWRECSSIARHLSLGFTAWLIGSLGKSMEDGSRDMSQMNGLQVLLSSRFTSNRNLQRLWSAVYRIQRGLERFLPEDLSELSATGPRELLSTVDRNYFSMVIEGIRSKLVSDPREQSLRNLKDVNATAVEKNGTADFLFPSALNVPSLRAAVASRRGYEDLDADPVLLENIRKTLKDRGEQDLARCDPDSTTTPTWCRLYKKNSYFESCRDLLEKSDRLLGNPCGCLPGNPLDCKSGTHERIACSNDLCENRLTKVECVPGECNAGSYCQNQRMQRMEYAKFKMQTFPGKGVGVVADEKIRSGTFIGEYQGEVIPMDTFHDRKKDYEGERHFYFMTLTTKLVIDASRRSQATRFVNHSCEPNAETQKWNAGGEPRVGIFAIKDIDKGEEITFDYGARSLANDTVPCLCQSKSCRGFLTVRNDQKETWECKDAPGLTDGQACGIGSPRSELNGHTALSAVTSGQKVKDSGSTKSPLNSENLRERVQQRIDHAKRFLLYADEIQKLQASLQPNPSKSFDESAIDDNTKYKVKQWEASVRRAVRRREKPAAFSMNESSVRIPRRGAAPPPAEPSSLLRTLMAPRAEVKKPAKKKAVPLEDVYYKVVTGNTRRGTFVRQTQATDPASSPLNTINVLPRNPTKAGLKNNIDLPVEDTGVGRRGPFVAVESRHNKPLPAPKIAKRPKPQGCESDVDSMDDYSIASSAEPIMDEPPPSPSHLPDGRGACSDDEFVAASPVVVPRGPAVDDRRQMERDVGKGWVCRPNGGGVARAGDDGHSALPRSQEPQVEAKVPHLVRSSPSARHYVREGQHNSSFGKLQLSPRHPQRPPGALSDRQGTRWHGTEEGGYRSRDLLVPKDHPERRLASREREYAELSSSHGARREQKRRSSHDYWENQRPREMNNSYRGGPELSTGFRDGHSVAMTEGGRGSQRTGDGFGSQDPGRALGKPESRDPAGFPFPRGPSQGPIVEPLGSSRHSRGPAGARGERGYHPVRDVHSWQGGSRLHPDRGGRGGPSVRGNQGFDVRARQDPKVGLGSRGRPYWEMSTGHYERRDGADGAYRNSPTRQSDYGKWRDSGPLRDADSGPRTVRRHSDFGHGGDSAQLRGSKRSPFAYAGKPVGFAGPSDVGRFNNTSSSAMNALSRGADNPTSGAGPNMSRDDAFGDVRATEAIEKAQLVGQGAKFPTSSAEKSSVVWQGRDDHGTARGGARELSRAGAVGSDKPNRAENTGSGALLPAAQEESGSAPENNNGERVCGPVAREPSDLDAQPAAEMPNLENTVPRDGRITSGENQSAGGTRREKQVEGTVTDGPMPPARVTARKEKTAESGHVKAVEKRNTGGSFGNTARGEDASRKLTESALRYEPSALRRSSQELLGATANSTPVDVLAANGRKGDVGARPLEDGPEASSQVVHAKPHATKPPVPANAHLNRDARPPAVAGPLDKQTARKRSSPTHDVGGEQREAKRRRDFGAALDRPVRGEEAPWPMIGREASAAAADGKQTSDKGKSNVARRSSAPAMRSSGDDLERHNSGTNVLSRIGLRPGAGDGASGGSGGGTGEGIAPGVGMNKGLRRSRSGGMHRSKNGYKGPGRGHHGRNHGGFGGKGGGGGRMGKRAGGGDGRNASGATENKSSQRSGSDLRNMLGKAKK